MPSILSPISRLSSARFFRSVLPWSTFLATFLTMTTHTLCVAAKPRLVPWTHRVLRAFLPLNRLFCLLKLLHLPQLHLENSDVRFKVHLAFQAHFYPLWEGLPNFPAVQALYLIHTGSINKNHIVLYIQITCVYTSVFRPTRLTVLRKRNTSFAPLPLDCELPLVANHVFSPCIHHNIPTPQGTQQTVKAGYIDGHWTNII